METRFVLLVGILLGVLGCGVAVDSVDRPAPWGAAGSGLGGDASGTGGGTPGLGGAVPAAGGELGTGGALATGGAAAGGQQATGGGTSSGGALATGGALGTGGTATGGALGTGGAEPDCRTGKLACDRYASAELLGHGWGDAACGTVELYGTDPGRSPGDVVCYYEPTFDGWRSEPLRVARIVSGYGGAVRCGETCSTQLCGGWGWYVGEELDPEGFEPRWC